MLKHLLVVAGILFICLLVEGLVVLSDRVMEDYRQPYGHINWFRG